MDKVNIKNFIDRKAVSVTISPAVYDMLELESARLTSQGLKASYRELADKAIIASYGNQQQKPAAQV
ncbi:MAG: hypothetical protein FWB90_03975 [Fibromonadales bacterium]|nr:hypothetical protein [Fibromonadales bacterium]